MLGIKARTKLGGHALGQRIIKLCSHKAEGTERFILPAKLCDRFGSGAIRNYELQYGVFKSLS